MNINSFKNSSGRSWILVTGASSGIGRATVCAFAEKGYRVLAGVRSETDANSLRAEHAKIVPLILDVAKDEHIVRLSDEVEGHTGADGLAALVNNSGINYVSPFAHTKEGRARELMEVNLMGLARVSQALVSHLRRHVLVSGQTAKLINVSSIGGAVGIPWESFYHASKFAVLGLSEALRLELWGERIVVSCVMPGGIRTPFVAKSAADMRASLSALSVDDPAHYAFAMRKMADGSRLVEKFGSKPEKVARRILSIVRREHPGFKHLVGLDAQMIYLLTKFVPSSLRHAILRPAFAA